MQIVRNRPCSTALTIGAALFLAIGFSACQTGTAGSGGGPPTPTDATISFCDDGGGSCTPATEFSVAAARDVVVTVNWENLATGTHTQLLEILQPGGGLYQSSQTSFLVPDSSHASMSVARTVPVAGAWIQQRRMTGEWSARVSLDGNAITTQTVQLNP